MSDLDALQRVVPEMARRAVPVPLVRLCSVLESMSLGVCMILVDGDTTPISATCAVGVSVPHGARAVVTFYPPHGIFVTGILSPLLLEQSWHAEFDTPSDAVGLTIGTGWTLLNEVSNGWSYLAPGLMCDQPGWWAIDLAVNFTDDDGSGTHRLATVIGPDGPILTVSQQFTGPGGSPLAGYGLGMAAGGSFAIEFGNSFVVETRQDSGSTIATTADLRLRWFSAL